MKNAIRLGVYQHHPIVLSANGHFTRLLFKNEHERFMYGVLQVTLCLIYSRYWPLNSRNIVRNIIYKRAICFRYQPVVIHSIKGCLPGERVQLIRAFLNNGIDLVDHLIVKTSICRNALLVKECSCNFFCFSAKAIMN